MTERDKVANADKSDSASSGANTSPIKKKRGNPENLRPRWQPGVSGNPNGRRPMPPEIIEALELGSLNAAKRLVALTQDPDGRVALTAIDMLQNRLYGRAQQQADVNVTTTNVQQAHLQVLVELQQRRDQAMKTIEADEVGGAENPIEIEPET